MILLFHLTGVFQPLFDKPLLPGLKFRLYCVCDIYGEDINKQLPGSDIVLASYWTRVGEVPLSAVGAMTNVTRNRIGHVIEPVWTVSVFTSALYRS